VLYPAFTSNPAANSYLARGRADWGGQFMPNIMANYISHDRLHNHYWFPPNSNVDLYVNQKVYPLSLPLVRQALAYAIDRQRVSAAAEYGYEPPANQSGVILPTFAGWYDKRLAAKYNYGYNPAKARSLLRQAGFQLGRSGLLQTKSGKRLSFSVIDFAGNTDWVASLRVIRTDLRRIGMELRLENLSSNDYNTRLFNGHFDLAYGGPAGGPTPYYDFRATLYSGNTASIGKVATTNYERWRSLQTDGLLQQFATTTNSARQHAIIDQLQSIMLQQVPVIPVTEGVSWFQWSTAKFTGWPSQANPYAEPAPYATPDWEVVLTTVRPKTSGTRQR
jgi:peptide/nickel transport system substrate-binding protein